MSCLFVRGVGRDKWQSIWHSDLRFAMSQQEGSPMIETRQAAVDFARTASFLYPRNNGEDITSPA